MANNAPQTNESSPFDVNGLPLPSGLIIPGQTLQAGVAGAALATDPNSGDQYTVAHIPAAAIPVFVDQAVSSGATWGTQAATLTGVAGRTLYLCGIFIESFLGAATQNLFWNFTGLSKGPGQIYATMSTAIAIEKTRIFAVPMPASAVAGSIVMTIGGGITPTTAQANVRWGMWGFAL